MTRRLIVSSTAALSALVLCGASSSAGAATASPAAGRAVSALQLVTASAGGHTLSAGGVQLLADALTSTKVARIALVPAEADGTQFGARTITPADSPVTVAAASTPSALAGLLSLASPSLGATVTDQPLSRLASSSLGSLKILGLSVPLNGSMTVGSVVDAAHGATATKGITLKNLALPSVADLLAALGLDLSKLPTATLTGLLDQLNLTTTVVDTAQAALTAGQATLTTKLAALTSAQGTLTTATSALTAALAAVPGAPALSTYLGQASVITQAFNALNPAVATAYTAYQTASTAVAAAQALVDTAQAALTGLLGSLVSAVTGVLDGTPLLSLGNLSLSSKAVVTSAKAGGQQAQVLGGTLSGLKVLGTDVLSTALGSSTLDVTGLTSAAAAKVNTTANGLLGTLSSVLSAVPGLTIPTPTVSLLAPTTSTGVVGGFGEALTSLTGLTISLPGITLPKTLALPGAASLPALSTVTGTATSLLSAPIAVRLLSFTDQAAYRPAVVGTPTGSTPGTTPPGELPRTGLPAGLAVLALVSIGGAVVLRRRATTG